MKKGNTVLFLYFLIPLLFFLFPEYGNRRQDEAKEAIRLIQTAAGKAYDFCQRIDFGSPTKPVFSDTSLSNPFPPSDTTNPGDSNQPGKDAPTGSPEPISKLKTIRIDAEIVYQYPTFPTGCESAAAVMALRFAGVDISLTEFIDKYLPRCPLDYSHLMPFEEGTLVYDHYFVGNPYSEFGKMCYEGPIIEAIKALSKDRGENLNAISLKGMNFESLLSALTSGPPILVWVTVNLATPRLDVDHYKPSHTVLLTGYDAKKDYVFYNDSILGKCKAKREQFQEIFEIVGSHAMIIEKKETVTP